MTTTTTVTPIPHLAHGQAVKDWRRRFLAATAILQDDEKKQMLPAYVHRTNGEVLIAESCSQYENLAEALSDIEALIDGEPSRMRRVNDFWSTKADSQAYSDLVSFFFSLKYEGKLAGLGNEMIMLKFLNEVPGSEKLYETHKTKIKSDMSDQDVADIFKAIQLELMKSKKDPKSSSLKVKREVDDDCDVFIVEDKVKYVNEHHSKEKGNPVGEISYPHIKTVQIKTEQHELLGKCEGYFCPICTEHFLMVDCFEKHVNEHHCKEKDHPAGDKNKTDQCSLDSTLPSVSHKIKDTLFGSKNVLVSENDDKLFKCNDCLFATAKEYRFKVHRRIHTGEKPFKCFHCPYTTAYRSSLQEHSSIHTCEQRFKCPDCSYTTAIKRYLQSHSKIHTGKKRWICPYCSYAALTNSNLQRHIRTHTGEKPFKCPDCAYATAYKYDMQRHSMRHTG